MTLHRTTGFRLWIGLGILLGMSAAIQGALLRSWDAEQVAAGARIALGFSGWIPFALVASCRQHLGTRWMAPDLPVSDGMHVWLAALLGTTPLWGIVVAQGCVGIGGASGLMLAGVHATTLGTLAAARSTGHRSENAVGSGIAIAVFTTIPSVAWPGATCLVELLLCGGSILFAQHKLEQRRTRP